jgi:hypothetical protein
VTDLQVDAARRQADISRTQRGSQAARAGAFGGARQAIENAEAERGLQSQLANIQAQGSQVRDQVKVVMRARGWQVLFENNTARHPGR